MNQPPMALIIMTLIAGAGWLIVTGHPVFGAIALIAAFVLAYDKM